MAITSMTGFARRDGSIGATRYTFEMRAVNGRGLDLRFRLPPGSDGLEAGLRTMAGEKIARGNVTVTLQTARADTGLGWRINEDLLERLLDAAARHAGRPGLAPPSIGELLAIKGVVEAGEEETLEDDRKALEAALKDVFSDHLADFLAARRSEGEALAAVLNGQIDEIERLARAVAAHPARSLEAIRDRLSEQIRSLLGRDDFDPQRLHQEAALMATRADVREELDRLAAHVGQARALLASGTAVGRRLDFLAQEFNRETNTLCSKSNDVEITRLGLDLKAVVDQFKEQVQNVE